MIIRIIGYIFAGVSVFYAFRSIFVIGGLFFTRKFKPAKNNHKYAILIAARNEETVIGNLIDSIHAQDYPSELVNIFVVADNCTDNTASIARERGAVCYERTDTEHRTKGYALQFLVENIKKDYGIDAFDGYFIFDADNLLKKDYISRMNDAFDSGEKIITSYRNTKNFDDNWIAASYGIHWLRTVRTEHRARSFLHLATRIQGTGFLFAWEVIKDGWNYTGFTEDRAFCADAVANGYKISYNDAAEFYDEQPTDIKIAMRQRIRWSKGHLQAVAETGPTLFSHIFVTKGAANRHNKENTSKGVKLFNNLRLRFMSYDMLSVVLPYSLMTLFRWFSLYILNAILIIMSTQYMVSVEIMPGFLKKYFGYFNIDVATGVNIATDALMWALAIFTLFSIIKTLLSFTGAIVTAAYVFIIEHRRIMHIKWYKKVWYCITFPLFDFIDKIAVSIALCSKVEWKPIPHKSTVTITDMDTKLKQNKPEYF